MSTVTTLLCLLALAAVASALSGWQKKILDKHNALRRKAAKGQARSGAGWMPYAGNMKLMRWDSRLASAAQSWAQRCVFQHSSGKWGENIAYTAGDPADKHAQMWEDEIDDYVDNPTRPYRGASNGKMIGHVTQMLWADSNKIGCGLANCDNFFKGATFLVCRYTVPGNFWDKPVYKEGASCSKCSGGCSDGLCS